MALAFGACHLSITMRRYRRCANLDERECAKCGYPKAPEAFRCPECGQSYAIRGTPKRPWRAVLLGLLLVAWPVVFAFGLRHYVGTGAGCLPNSALFVLAEYFASEPALKELDERMAIGHSRLPAWLAQPPDPHAYAMLCARLLASPHPTYAQQLAAYEALCLGESDDLVIGDALADILDSDSAEVRGRAVELLEAMHARAPARFAIVVTARRKQELLEDPSLDVRLHSARMLWASDKDPRATAVFEEALGTEEGRAAALFRLTNPLSLNGVDSRLGPAIVTALRESSDQRPGLEALESLAYISDETLHELMRVEWANDRAMASYHRILARTGPRAFVELERLRERLGYENDWVQTTAAMALGAIGKGASEAVPELELLVRESDSSGVVVGALKAVEQIVGERAYPLAIDVLDASESELVQECALDIMVAYGAPGDERACSALRRFLARGGTLRVRDRARAVLDRFCKSA